MRWWVGSQTVRWMHPLRSSRYCRCLAVLVPLLLPLADGCGGVEAVDEMRDARYSRADIFFGSIVNATIGRLRVSLRSSPL